MEAIRIHTPARVQCLIGCCAMVVVLLVAGCRETQNTDLHHAEMVAGGRASFQAYCASCHGSHATGDGPVASQLTVRPADLTKIAQRAGGEFPTDYVTATIDGRQELAAHGTRNMPVWGQVWRSGTDRAEAEAEASRKLEEIVEFLKSIQV